MYACMYVWLHAGDSVCGWGHRGESGAVRRVRASQDGPKVAGLPRELPRHGQVHAGLPSHMPAVLPFYLSNLLLLLLLCAAGRSQTRRWTRCSWRCGRAWRTSSTWSCGELVTCWRDNVWCCTSCTQELNLRDIFPLLAFAQKHLLLNS
jgi:hypothetical protein